MSCKYFTPLDKKAYFNLIPEKLNNPFDSNIPEISKIAAIKLQQYIIDNQEKWVHNFGIKTAKTNAIKGKMFGVLVVETENKELGYLSAFSGKLDDDNFEHIFVPSIFDTSTEDYFLDKGMTELTNICLQIETLATQPNTATAVEELKAIRKNKSVFLQEKIFDQYIFLNLSGKSKTLREVFDEFSTKKPAGGAGECAAPKLLQHAIKNKMKPIAIAEFWWGLTKTKREHLEFYPACNDKCRPILGYMLSH